MQRLGIVTSEGGPLIILDSARAPEWRGGDDGGDDYWRACALFDSDPSAEGGEIATRHGGRAILWEMLRGAGVADVFGLGLAEFVIVRAWLDDPDSEPDPRLAVGPGVAEIPLGVLSVPSGVAVVLWAAESGRCFGQATEGELPGGLSVASAGLAVSCEPGRYDVVHDATGAGARAARRCRLRRRRPCEP